MQEANRGKIVTDEVLIVEARISNYDFSCGLRIIAAKMMTLGEARSRYARALQLHMKGEVGDNGDARATADKLQSLLTPYNSGGCPVQVRYHNAVGEGELHLGETWRVRPEDALLDSLTEWLSADAVEVTYRN